MSTGRLEMTAAPTWRAPATVEVWTGPWRRGDHPQRKVSECTRAELWAAIDRLDALAYSLGCIEGADLRVVRARQRAQARRRVRELLGLEIER